MAAISSREVAQEQRPSEGAGTLARPPGNSVSGSKLGQGLLALAPWFLSLGTSFSASASGMMTWKRET